MTRRASGVSRRRSICPKVAFFIICPLKCSERPHERRFPCSILAEKSADASRAIESCLNPV